MSEKGPFSPPKASSLSNDTLTERPSISGTVDAVRESSKHEYGNLLRLPSRSEMESLWNTLAGEQFEESPYRPVQVGGVTMCALYVDRNNEERKYTTDLYFDTGLSFVAKPRFLSYRHRFVLVPKDNISGANRWDMRASDVADWIRWSEHM